MARGQQASEGGAQALTEQESRKDMAMTSAGRCAGRTRGGVAGRLRLLASGEVWRATLYLLLNWVSGTFWLAALFTLVSLGIGLAYTVVGLLILALTMRLWMAGASLERRRTAVLLGTRIASPYRPPPERGLMNQALSRAGDPAVWRDLLYLVLLFPLGTVEGALVALAWSSLLFCLGAVVYLPYQALSSGASLEALPLVLPAAAGGLALAVAAPGAIIAMARRHGRLAQTLLGPTATREHLLAGKVEELRESRARLLDAALTERRRIERDLHDGAQQRLVAVAMGLGRAREKMKTDPEAAATLVAEAHEQTKLAIRDIRELVRGIHPAVLGDRGLDAALSALAGRSPVPIRVDVTLDHRPPEAIEATAYFVAAEALTNIARHSRATHAWVSVSCANGRLKLEIGDDGAGGAVAAPGGGLAGLADRVTALGGRFAIASPPGGPTRIQVDLPCE